jgi:hypothetical protein
MSALPEVDRQFREVNSYNLFYSVMTARASPCLAEHGWFLPLMFGEITDSYNNVTVKPDFVLYDGDICLIAELKSGNNIEQRDINQMERCGELSIDGVEEELQAANVQEKTPYDGTVRTIDSCIIYQDIDEDWIENCRNEWDDCRGKLEDLEEKTAVLTQDYGGKLRRLTGAFESGRLQRQFNEGIELPLNPKEEIVLTEQMEKEILAIAVCDIWGEQAIDYEEPVQTNVNEVRDHFAPRFNIPPRKVNRTLYYLHMIDACDHIEDLTYEFSRNHISEILQIKETVRNERVENALEDENEDRIPDEQQATLDMDLSSNEKVTNGSGVGEEN